MTITAFDRPHAATAPARTRVDGLVTDDRRVAVVRLTVTAGRSPEPRPRVLPGHPRRFLDRRHAMIRKFAPTLAGLSSFMLTALVLLVSHHA